MFVKLLTYTPDPERTAAAAARQCYSPTPASEGMEGLSQENARTLIHNVIKRGHTSVMEHVSFTFAISGISRVTSHQLVRHRIASYSQQSQRYVDERGFSAVTPPAVAKDKQAEAIFLAAVEEARRAYENLVKLGIKKEDARYLLPNATETQLVATFNARSLYNFFSLRLCERAQWEIRELAEKMLSEVKKVAPALFELAGPPCETSGKCPEGANSCRRLRGGKA